MRYIDVYYTLSICAHAKDTAHWRALSKQTLSSPLVTSSQHMSINSSVPKSSKADPEESWKLYSLFHFLKLQSLLLHVDLVMLQKKMKLTIVALPSLCYVHKCVKSPGVHDIDLVKAFNNADKRSIRNRIWVLIQAQNIDSWPHCLLLPKQVSAVNEDCTLKI